MMKPILYISTLLIFSISNAQNRESYYDFAWKPAPPEYATYYSTIKKTDSGWLRTDYFIKTRKLQMSALYADDSCKIRNGHSIFYHANGIPSVIGRMSNNKNVGICVSYYYNGVMSDSALFVDGKVSDKRFRWHRNGMLSDSIARIADSTYVNYGWFDDGMISYAGYSVHDKKIRKWQYFHHNGKLAALETYDNGKLIAGEYFDESGNIISDTSHINQPASFKDDSKTWYKYLDKHLHWPLDLHFNKAGKIAVEVDFGIDENGNVVDPIVTLPLHPRFDKAVLDAIKSSPKWKPTISHNRKVKVYLSQTIIFHEPEG